MKPELSGAGWSSWSDGPEPAAPLLPSDRYRIDGLLGRGGMGEVFRAWDTHLDRFVALKRVRSDVVDPTLLARLLREAKVTATLDHPGIVPILDLGETDEGLFYTMRLIRGQTLSAAVGALPPEQLLRHFLDAVQAVAFAHAHGVVHRDLKPENIMVGTFGETQVVDWGLARRVDQADLPISTGSADGPDDELTRAGGVLGTARYLPPEVLAGARMARRADVYALGATLVELLTGERGLDAASWRALTVELAPELATIAGRALADAEERTADAGALAIDLQTYLDGGNVRAHTYSTLDVARRVAKRYRWPLRVLGSGLLAAALGLTVAVVGVLRERDRAVSAEVRERQARLAADEALAQSLAQQAVQALREGSRWDARVFSEQALGLAEIPRARGVLMAVRAVPPAVIETVPPHCDGSLVLGRSGALCRDEHDVWSRDGIPLDHPDVDDAERTPTGAWLALREGTRHVGDPAFEGAGQGLLITDGLRAARLLMTRLTVLHAEGRSFTREPCGSARSFRTAAWDEAGIWLVCLDGCAVHTTTHGIERRVTLPGLSSEIHAMVAPPGRLLLATAEGELDVRDTTTGARLALERPGIGRIRRLDVSPDGRWLLIQGDHLGPALWNMEARRVQLRLPTAWRSAVFQADGRLAVVDGEVQFLDPETVEDPGLYSPVGLSTAVLSPDGEVAGAGGDGLVRVWDLQSGRLRQTIPVQPGFVVKAVTYSPDGAVLSAASNGAHQVRRFRADDGTPLPGLPRSKYCRRLLALEQSVWCLSYTGFLPVRLELDTPEEPSPSSFIDAGQSGPIHGVVVDEDGRLLALEGAQPPRPLATLPGAGRVDVDAAGQTFVVGVGGEVVVLDAEGRERSRWDAAEGLQDVAISPDGAWVAGASLDGVVSIWSAEGRLQAVLEGVHLERVVSVQFNADWVITAGWDGRVQRWSLPAMTASMERPGPDREQP